MSLRKIVVINTPVIKEGTSASGNPWKLCEVVATNEDGSPITEKLKTFDELKPGLVEVDVEKQEDDQWGPSYMLRLPRAGGGGGGSGARLGPKVDELRDRIDRLDQQVKYLISEVRGLVQLAHQGGDTYTPAPPELDPALTGEGKAQFGGEADEDIPF